MAAAHKSTLPLLNTNTTSSNSNSNISVLQVSPRLTRIILNRPEKLNSLNLPMVHELMPVVTNLPRESIMILEGAGGKAFCAGGDVASIRKEVIDGGNLPHDFFFHEYHLDYAISQLFKRKVVQVSIWDGVTMGGGVGLSIHGPLRICTEKTLFSMPEVGIGLFPDVGATYALSRIKQGPELGLYLALTGIRLGASDCLWSGLATHYLPSNRLDTLRESLTKFIHESPHYDVSSISTIINKVNDGIVPDNKKDVLEKNITSIRQVFSGVKSVEEILTRLDGHGTDWSANTAQAIRKASPLSVKVSFEAIKKHSSESISLADAFATEYRLSQRFMRPQPLSDFTEGIRAVLVDKDQKPKWSHQSILDVKQDVVKAFFDPLEKNHPKGELW
jgi:enoyl-CoA hydratase/carnithine racemase